MLCSILLHYTEKKEYEMNPPFYIENQYKVRNNIKPFITLFCPTSPSILNTAEHSPEATIAIGPEEDPHVRLSGAWGIFLVLMKQNWEI